MKKATNLYAVCCEAPDCPSLLSYERLARRKEVGVKLPRGWRLVTTYDTEKVFCPAHNKRRASRRSAQQHSGLRAA